MSNNNNKNTQPHIEINMNSVSTRDEADGRRSRVRSPARATQPSQPSPNRRIVDVNN